MTRSGRQASQQPRELRGFIDLLLSEKVTSYLEVGASHGDTFHEIVMHLPIGSKALAIDLPNGPWGSDSMANLLSATADLCERGYDASCIFGDSQKINAPKFDAVFIDADHRYEAVKADWEKFKSPITAFHDIDGEGVKLMDMEIGVPQLWAELKPHYRHVEFIVPDDDRKMGIGVLFT